MLAAFAALHICTKCSALVIIACHHYWWCCGLSCDPTCKQSFRLARVTWSISGIYVSMSYKKKIYDRVRQRRRAARCLCNTVCSSPSSRSFPGIGPHSFPIPRGSHRSAAKHDWVFNIVWAAHLLLYILHIISKLSQVF